MSTAELETTKAIIISLQKQKISRFVIAEFVLEYWLRRLSYMTEVYIGFCDRYADAISAYVYYQTMASNDFLAIQREMSVGGVNLDQLLLNHSLSTEKELSTGDIADKMYYVEFPPIALEIKKIKWFIIYKLLNGLTDRRRGWKKLVEAMKGHNRDKILRVKRANKF